MSFWRDCSIVVRICCPRRFVYASLSNFNWILIVTGCWWVIVCPISELNLWMAQLECYSVISRYDHRVTWMTDQITWLTDWPSIHFCMFASLNWALARWLVFSLTLFAVVWMFTVPNGVMREDETDHYGKRSSDGSLRYTCEEIVWDANKSQNVELDWIPYRIALSRMIFPAYDAFNVFWNCGWFIS